jgi:hypothetical protein
MHGEKFWPLEPIKVYNVFRALMSYGIIFWRCSYHSINIFQMQKRVIGIITDCENRNSCRILFKKLKIWPLMSQYILSLFIFVVNYRDQFLINSDIHNINIWHISHLLLPLENVGIYQQGLYYSGIMSSFLLVLKNFSVIWGHLKVL